MRNENFDKINKKTALTPKPDWRLATPKRPRSKTLRYFFPIRFSLVVRTNENTSLLFNNLIHHKKPPLWTVFCGVPDWIRTNDTQRRRLVLYPTELRIRIFSFSKKSTYILLFFTSFLQAFVIYYFQIPNFFSAQIKKDWWFLWRKLSLLV